MSNPTQGHLRYWIPALVWAAVIFVFSTSSFAAIHTSRFFIPILKWLMPSASAVELSRVHDLIRKLSHFVEFFIFSMLLFRGFRGPGRGWRLSWAAWTVVLALCYAALDEVHQLFVPTRGASVRDVLLDGLGAITAQVLLWAFYRFRMGRQS